MRSDLAQTKVLRRRTLRDTFPHPLSQIALQHVDSVAALADDRRLILSKAIQKTDLRYAATFVDILNRGGDRIQNEDDLVALISPTTVKNVESRIDKTKTGEVDPADTDYLVNLLMKCYPDMLPTSADALARADVMESSLRVCAVFSLPCALIYFLIVAPLTSHFICARCIRHGFWMPCLFGARKSVFFHRQDLLCENTFQL